jgi:hypothetical protein
MKTMQVKKSLCVTVKFFVLMLFMVSVVIAQEISTEISTDVSENTPQEDVSILEVPSDQTTITETVANTVMTEIDVQDGNKFIRGIHLTIWMAAAPKQRRAVLELLKTTELNAVVIDIKEFEGKVYIDNIEAAKTNNTYAYMTNTLPQFLKQMKDADMYSIARIVVFRDNLMPRINPALAVKNPDGSLWRDRNGITWLDPYNEQARDYILQIAEKAAEMGFDEIQFDYIRFPSDGDISKARYSNKQHNGQSASDALVAFLQEANARLKDKGVKISIDVFGLTTTATSKDGLGIGQRIIEMAKWVDFVSPMVYPSHYGEGSFGVQDPNKEPYKIVYTAMQGALKRIPAEKLRPWLQDFTMKAYPYRREQVRAQIQATYDNDIGSWLLWNPRCVYTISALKGQEHEAVYEKRVRRRN